MIHSTPRVCTPETLMSCLEHYASQHLTGCLTITFSPTVTIDLYFNLGYFAWATGGLHPVRRLKRQLRRYCAKVLAHPLPLSQGEQVANWGYNLLLTLRRRELVDAPTMNELLRAIILEVLFDLWQDLTRQPHTSHPCAFLTERPGVRPSDQGILSSQDSLQVQSLVTQSLTQWQNWQKANLTRCSPNLAVQVLNAPALAQAVSPAVYQNFSRLMTGQRTLRDIAELMQQTPLRVARSLSPYIQQRILGVNPIGDLPASAIFAPVTHQSPAPSKSAPLIACIDDSPHLCHLMEELLTEAGYRFLPINDPLKALPLLIQHRPNVIFLDLMMPIANGYEICAQIQRVSTLKNTPVVILTAQDGMVDRVRAKLVGATTFISKPINTTQILNLLKQFTAAASRPSLHHNS